MSPKSLKIVFFGTPDLSVPFLEALTNEPDFEVLAVVTQPDRPVGRKQILTPSPVKELALTKKIEIFQPENLKKDSITPRLHHSSRCGRCGCLWNNNSSGRSKLASPWLY